MLYNVCLFDLDGTLTDSKEGIINSFRYALARYGIKPPADGLDRFIGPALRDSFRDFFGFTDERAEEAVAVYREYYSTRGMYENKLYPGVADMLKDLKESGAVLSLATSKTAVYAGMILKHFDICDYFDFVAGSEFDGTRSGKKELIIYALENLHKKSRKNFPAVMIGDREYDIAGAKQAGIKSIGAAYGYGARDELTQAGADHIADSPEEIYGIIRGGN